ncbi:MAG TPA: hypothetical protein VH092_00890, partial [Urbifossiella sp.]|nr:hypothetical protein [Urbifossiella sp.]
MSWPLSHDFNEAIQNPAVVFADPALKAGETVVGATGLPLPRSGNFADVYQVRGADGRDWAVKCFTRPVAGLAERYAKVSAALAAASLPFTVGFEFQGEGMLVGGAWRPVVKMEWVEGLLLNQVARENAAKPAVLAALGQVWVKLCKRLRDAGVAHADVQHGNVLLVPGSRAGAFGLKLIDYDGMWVPALANTPSGEAGHSSYQHPARAATRAYSPDLDRFPFLAVAAALRGLAAGGPALWERCDNGDNLLFVEADYKNPAGSAVMKELWHTGDPAVQALVGRLAVACGKSIPQTPWLDQIAPDGEPLPLDAATRREAAAALGLAAPVSVPPPPPRPSTPPPQTPPAWTAPAPQREETGLDLFEPGRHSPARGRAGAPGSRMPVYAAGLLLLVIGGVIAGILVGVKSRPAETVRQEGGEPGNGPPKDPEAAPPDPQPKDQEPGEIVPPAKSPDPPAVPVSPAAKYPWSVPAERQFDRLYVSAGAKAVFAGAEGYGGAAFDLGTGAPRPEFADLGKTRPRHFVAMTSGRLGTWGFDPRTVQRWDEKTGRELTPLKIPTVAPPAEKGTLPLTMIGVAPNGKVAAFGWTREVNKADADLPLTLLDLARNEPVKELTWAGGHVYFTADSARVLVAERSGRCRWFKVPSGDADGEWEFRPAAGRHEVTSVSADGSVLGYVGPFARPGGGSGPLTVNGKTGEVLWQFPSAAGTTRVHVSA